MTRRLRPYTSSLPSVLCDPQALLRLGQIAGPEAGRELFAQMAEDLESARIGLTHAVDPVDLVALRGHSHVLISLAGTVGARAVQEDAVTLNDMLHRHDPAQPIVARAKAMDAPLRQMIAELRNMTAQMVNGGET